MTTQHGRRAVVVTAGRDADENEARSDMEAAGGPAASRPAERPRRRVAVVSFHAHHPFTPRGERTREVVRALRETWDVEVIAGPPPASSRIGVPSTGRTARAAVRRAARVAATHVLLDVWEHWSLRTLFRWTADVDAALLIGYPFSPAVYAARHLRRDGIPYVLDAGDPWALTTPEEDADGRSLGFARSRRAERRLWEHAAGAILTTHAQAARLRSLFGALPILVRPNGYGDVAPPVPSSQSSDHRRLRLAHFGMLSSARIDLSPFLGALQDSGRWDQISFAQYGDDFAGMLARAPAGIAIEQHAAIPWGEVVSRARNYDLAVAIGNVSPTQLPSKAVQYLTLPIPRVALTRSSTDSLATYVAQQPGWLIVTADDAGAGHRVAEHLAAPWTAAALAPPASESWSGVAAEVVRFFDDCVGRR